MKNWHVLYSFYFSPPLFGLMKQLAPQHYMLFFSLSPCRAKRCTLAYKTFESTV